MGLGFEPNLNTQSPIFFKDIKKIVIFLFNFYFNNYIF